MTSIKLTVIGAQAQASVTGPLTSGMVGIPVAIEYDEAWDGLTKNLMCRCSPWGSNDGENRAILNVGETAAVAHEVMLADMYLYLGVEGFNDDGTLVMPTTWACCGKIAYGANTCEDPSTDPSLSVWNQLQIEMEQTKEYVLTPEQAVNIQVYAQEARQAAEEAKQTAENGLYYTPVVTQPTDSTLKFEFQPSVIGAPSPNPVTVELPIGEGLGQDVILTAAQINALDGLFKIAHYNADSSAAYAAFQAAFGLSDAGGDSGGDTGGDSGDDAGGDSGTFLLTDIAASIASNVTANGDADAYSETYTLAGIRIGDVITTYHSSGTVTTGLFNGDGTDLTNLAATAADAEMTAIFGSTVYRYTFTAASAYAEFKVTNRINYNKKGVVATLTREGGV